VSTGSFKLGLIGSNIRDSRSPRMHVKEGEFHGLHVTYNLIDPLEDFNPAFNLADLLSKMENDGYDGINVTHPFKQSVLPLLDWISTEAQEIGAVNTVLFRDGKRLGFNTDWIGFSEAMRSSGIEGSVSALLLGAGGAGAASAYAALKHRLKTLYFYDPAEDRADALKTKLKLLFPQKIIQIVSPEKFHLLQFDGIIQATPVGMAENSSLPIDPKHLTPDRWLAELIYFPIITPLLRAAKEMGCKTVDGSTMAIHQASAAFELFTGYRAKTQHMTESFLSQAS
jgi:shikimate dehydrogenase